MSLNGKKNSEMGLKKQIQLQKEIKVTKNAETTGASLRITYLMR